jgi:pSer/pThr/pTyr-binding forkhead associated (FHA) protein
MNGNDSFELILQALDASQNSFYCITTKGAKLGRHASNEIVILEESVSRYHAQIIWEPSLSQYFIKDKGSTTGTFIKVQDRMELLEGSVFEMGSVQFLITHLDPIRKNVQMTVIDGPDNLLNTKYDSIVPIKVGRKGENHISYPDDMHLSNSHAEIFMMEQTFYIEDRASTNGYKRSYLM